MEDNNVREDKVKVNSEGEKGSNGEEKALNLTHSSTIRVVRISFSPSLIQVHMVLVKYTWL